MRRLFFLVASLLWFVVSLAGFVWIVISLQPMEARPGWVLADLPAWIPANVQAWLPPDLSGWIPTTLPDWVPSQIPQWASSNLPDWLLDGLSDAPWLTMGLRLLGGLMVGISFSALAISVFNFGAKAQSWSLMKSQENRELYELRFPWGMKWGVAIMAIGLSLGILYTLIATDEPTLEWIIPGILIIVFAYGGAMVLCIHVDFNRENLYVVNYWLRREQYAWRELESMSYSKTWQEVHLRFSTGETARISLYYNGMDDFLTFVEDQLMTRHGLASGT